MQCPSCKGEVEAADRHCRHCGLALAAPAPAAGNAPGPRRIPGWWFVVIGLAGLGLLLVTQRDADGGRDRIVSHERPPAALPGGGKRVDPVVAVSHAAVTLISVLDEYFDTTGELPLSLVDTGFTPEDIHPGIAVDYERDTGRIHVSSTDGKLSFSAVIESPVEGDSWWVCESGTLPSEEWPARCRVPQAAAPIAEAPAADGDVGGEAAFPLGENEGGNAMDATGNAEGNASGGAAEPAAPPP